MIINVNVNKHTHKKLEENFFDATYFIVNTNKHKHEQIQKHRDENYEKTHAVQTDFKIKR